MNESELMDKLLLSVTDHINPNKKHWVTLYRESVLREDNGIFELLKDFSDKNTRMGDDSKSQSFSGLNTLELRDKIFVLCNKNRKVKSFFDLL